MAVLGVPSRIDGEAIIEAKWADRQVQAKANSKIGAESIERAPRADHVDQGSGCWRWSTYSCHWINLAGVSGGNAELVEKSRCDCVISSRDINRAGTEIPPIL